MYESKRSQWKLGHIILVSQ